MQSMRQVQEQGRADARLRKLHRDGYSRQEAAEVLGVTVRTVIRWAKRLGLTRGARK